VAIFFFEFSVFAPGGEKNGKSTKDNTNELSVACLRPRFLVVIFFLYLIIRHVIARRLNGERSDSCATVWEQLETKTFFLGRRSLFFSPFFFFGVFDTTLMSIKSVYSLSLSRRRFFGVLDTALMTISD
jgi:hypothetical protein